MIIKAYQKEDYFEGQNIIIYGAGIYGEIAFNALKTWGVSTYCFADRNETVTVKCGLPVIRPDEIKKVNNAAVLLASVNYLNEMAEFLSKEGVQNFYSISELLETRIDDKNISEYSKDIIRNSGGYRFNLESLANDKFTLRNIDLVVTEYCNLRCKDCGSLLPYYQKPRHVSLEEIENPLRNFLDTIDELYELRLLGGETFVYPYLSSLLDLCGKLDKVKRIVIYTNSTIVPDDLIFEKIKKNGVVLHMSNYGIYSTKVYELEQKCSEYGIEYYTHEYCEWRNMGTTEFRDYNPDTVKRIYMMCDNAKCPSFYRGKLYICPRAAHGEGIGAFKNAEGESVDFTGIIDIHEKRKELNTLLKEKELFHACYYCNGNSVHAKPIPAAVQL